MISPGPGRRSWCCTQACSRILPHDAVDLSRRDSATSTARPDRPGGPRDAHSSHPRHPQVELREMPTRPPIRARVRVPPVARIWRAVCIANCVPSLLVRPRPRRGRRAIRGDTAEPRQHHHSEPPPPPPQATSQAEIDTLATVHDLTVINHDDLPQLDAEAWAAGRTVALCNRNADGLPRCARSPAGRRRGGDCAVRQQSARSGWRGSCSGRAKVARAGGTCEGWSNVRRSCLVSRMGGLVHGSLCAPVAGGDFRAWELIMSLRAHSPGGRCAASPRSLGHRQG